MTRTIYSSILWVVMFVSLIVTLNLYFSEKANSNRLFSNLKAVNEQAETYTTRDGYPATKKTIQELSTKELKQAFPEATAIIKNMRIEPRRVQSFTQLSQGLTIKVKAPVTDSVLFDTRLNDSLQVKKLNYSDKWISIQAEIKPDTGLITIAAIDTIYTSIYKGKRRRPALWIFSRRNYEAAATNRSPYIKIQVVQGITIKK
ncbi:MAG: hypothetical protein Q8R96_11590 [Bacteroidota bacterium]|nr:hypothetical protein [Bacteroidota bacterium]